MKKVRLLIVAFVLAVTFSACESSDSLDELLDTTDIESVDNTTDDDEENDDEENGKELDFG